MHSFDDPLHFHDLQWKQNSVILSHFLFNFENLSAHLVANIQNTPNFCILDEFEGS